ncbi:RUS1 family protein [bacterium]|nr:RUS1 family protein [bacterium]
MLKIQNAHRPPVLSSPRPTQPPPPPQPPKSNRSDELETLLKAQPREVSLNGLLKSTRESLQSLFIPKNVEKTMTKDYLPTRLWWMGREVMSNLSYGFAASQATSLALELVVKSQPAAAVATVGLGLGMYWFPKVVDQFRNATSMASSTLAPVADRRPKAWFLAGDILDNLGTAVMSCAALMPGLYAPLSIGVGAAFTVAGVLKRRAQSNMFYRQAINPRDTLPEINTKESNQSIVLNLVSMGAGAALQWGIGATGLAAGLPIVGLAAAALGTLATVRFLSHLDMENINESVVRRTLDRLEQGQEVSAPDRKVGRLLTQLLERDKIELGQDLIRLKQAGSARYQDLLSTYQSKNYLLESFKGQPYIVMKEGASKEDSLAAVIQAIHVEKLRATPEYQQVEQSRGSDAADYWLVEQSLARAQAQTPGLLERFQAQGWATDLVNFRDREERYSQQDLEKPLDPGQAALP